MCTITYLPYKNGYIVTQNRDESPLRAEAVFPINQVIQQQKIIYPKDPEGSGSWFVSAQNGLTLCVMNGAYHPHKKAGNYKHSRGLIPLHYFNFENAQDFIKNYNYQKLEAFTLLACSTNGVEEFIWDENQMNHFIYKNKPLIFQSAPLYNAQQKAIRKDLFKTFLLQNNAINIVDFHTKPQTTDLALNILMDRQIVKSISTIQRVFYQDKNTVNYLKLGAKNFISASF